jgi:hypothetical protein
VETRRTADALGAVEAVEAVEAAAVADGTKRFPVAVAKAVAVVASGVLKVPGTDATLISPRE